MRHENLASRKLVGVKLSADALRVCPSSERMMQTYYGIFCVVIP